MTQHTYSLGDLVREVSNAIQDVDEQVLSSDYIRHEVIGLKKGPSGAAAYSGFKPIGFEPMSFDYSDPEAHFANYDAIRLWEKYFAFVLREWNLDEHGERMGNSELNFLIERLSASATQLDLYSPLLVAEYAGVRNAPWSNSTLITCVTLCTVASAILSAYGYSVAIQTPKDATWDSPEFYNMAQNALMQLLGLYVTIVPALRHKNLQTSYHRWSWVLVGLGFIAPFMAIGYFLRGPDASQLVLFMGSAIQSTIILQLIWAVDNIERKRE
ncbi:hypothetical protein E0Z10_g9487 [Xylaria hypoxylon]|uniref:Uncharacterized protein n=1 Tax=Xylaria hypoxylon TaxID=37992 RepID=A0A4Z0YNR4_9PEZI|nr:hypothetical protein E0Z10_g9487 [Xylaria hypoxylon]